MLRTLMLCLILTGLIFKTGITQSKWRLDSAYVHTYEDTWSLRLYSIVKAQGLRLENDAAGQVRYLPDNIFGLGLGISYRFLVLDLGLTLGGEQNLSSRIDLQGNVFFRKHIFDFYFQAYQGFELLEPEPANPQQKFRNDFRTLAFGINYLYNFKGDRLAIRSTTVGDYRQARTEGSWLVGGFTSFYLFKAPQAQ